METRDRSAVRALLLTPDHELLLSEHTFLWEGVRIRQSERYFLVRTPRFDPRTDGVPEGAEETLWFRGYRWWTLKELLRTDELLVPRELGIHLKSLVDKGIPSSPVEVGI